MIFHLISKSVLLLTKNGEEVDPIKILSINQQLLQNGPEGLREECGDQFDWTIQDCRRVDLNSEDLGGSESEASFDIYSDTPDAT